MARNIFQSAKFNKPKMSLFDLSHERKFSCNMGDLIPILVQEVVPGDVFRNNTEILLRMAPMLAPVMHRVNVYTHFFFVPNRLVWNSWQSFITGGDKGDANPVHPFIPLNADTQSQFGIGHLSDYFNIPIPGVHPIVDTIKINALPFRAYQLIFNEYYRDQSLQEPINIIPTSGQEININAMLQLRKRNWEKDYFTSALPWAQKGEPVVIPVEGVAPVKLDNSHGEIAQKLKKIDGSPSRPGNTLVTDTLSEGHTSMYTNDDGEIANIDPNNTLFADLQNVTATSINDLRKAFQLQKWLERNAVAGSRYIESILGHFGVQSSDARLQRPEFLGGGKSNVVISEVLQTSSTTDDSPQANMAGHGLSVGNSHEFTRRFEEHGFVIGIMSVMPRTAYQQGIPRQYSKFDKFEYLWPLFTNLGEQEVKRQELFVDFGDPENRQETFGYQSRYAEYKYIASSVHGDFRNNLSYWHMGRIFDNDNPPVLSPDFIEANPTHRIFNVEDPTIDKLYVQVFNNLRAKRPLPYFSTPGLIDH